VVDPAAPCRLGLVSVNVQSNDVGTDQFGGGRLSARSTANAAAIATLEARLPTASWRGEAAGLDLYVTLPEHADETVLARAADDRGVLVGLGAWH
jgi:hypothetical protein